MQTMKLWMAVCCAVMALPQGDAPRSWVEVDGRVCGARPDQQGPIGGGKGYKHVVTDGDRTVRTIDELLDALSRAKAGEVVFIPGDTVLDLTGRVFIEKLVLEVPAGVTLASDRGHDGSAGALLCSDALATEILIRAAGPGVRITGLRLRGPNPKRHMDHFRRARAWGKANKKDWHEYFYKFPTQSGIYTTHDRLEVDNCDISAFGRAGIALIKGKDHHIHHNRIHHCQYHGLGYGISHSYAISLIEFNLFDWNRHSIAAAGWPDSGYVARNNIDYGHTISHNFDIHGGGNRKDGTKIASQSFQIVNNTFYSPIVCIGIRGVPVEESLIARNWFVRHDRIDGSCLHEKGNVEVVDNVCGENPRSLRNPSPGQ